MTDTPSPQLNCKCGCPLVAGMKLCAACWQKFRDEAIAHRERRQEQERVQAEAREQGRIGEGQ